MKILLLSGLLLLPFGTEDKFIPTNPDATTLVCAVSVQPNGSANAVVIARYDTHGEYRAVMAIRPDRIAAAHDCQAWYTNLAEAWKK